MLARLLGLSILMIAFSSFAVDSDELLNIADCMHRNQVLICDESDTACYEKASQKKDAYLELIAEVERIKNENLKKDLCREKFLSSLTSDSEKFLNDKFPDNFKQFNPSCNNSSDMDFALVGGIGVLHEDVHYQDIGYDGTHKVNFITVDNEFLGGFSGHENLPETPKLINPFLEKNFKDLISGDNFFTETHLGYIGDLEFPAGTDLLYMTSELNAYTHGLKYEHSVRGKLSNPKMIGSSQYDGVYYFLTMFDNYLKLAKENNKNDWSILTNKTNKKILQKIFKSSIDTLDKANHCDNAKEVTQYSSQWLNFVKSQKISKEMKEFLPVDGEKKLRCL